jgi:hypothetical protein
MSRLRLCLCISIISFLRRLRLPPVGWAIPVRALLVCRRSPLLALLVACAWLMAFSASARAGGKPSLLQISATLLQDDGFCLGCHGRASHAKNAPLIDRATLQDSAHEGLKCSGCHTAITTIPHPPRPAHVDCTPCHPGDTRQASLKAQAGKEAPLDQHSTATRHGAKGLPECANCHGTHGIRLISDVNSRVGRNSIASTCGACHQQEARLYRESVHGAMTLRDNPDTPTCVTCHPEHARLGKRGVFQHGVVKTCGSCHESAALEAKYAIPGDRLASYLGSYHGIATKLGYQRTANCASCHGNHLILPSEDPRSATNPANLPRTCGKCHPKVNENVARGKVHIMATAESGGLVYRINVAFKWFTLCTIGALVGHISLELFARTRRRRGGFE